MVHFLSVNVTKTSTRYLRRQTQELRRMQEYVQAARPGCVWVCFGHNIHQHFQWVLFNCAPCVPDQWTRPKLQPSCIRSHSSSPTASRVDGRVSAVLRNG